jgi:hypothetical protein
VEHVKQRCLPGGLNLPLLEEYDYHNDSTNPDIAIELLPHVRHRPYQEKSLTKLLGNGKHILPLSFRTRKNEKKGKLLKMCEFLRYTYLTIDCDYRVRSTS